MNKKDLIKLKTPKITECYKKVVREDIGEEKIRYGSYYGDRKTSHHRVHKYYRFLKAAVEDEILKVGIWTRASILNGQEIPDFTVYFDKSEEKWLTFEYETGRWLTGMIFNLPYARQDGEPWGIIHWCDSSTTKAIEEYFGKQGTAYSIIKEYQTSQKEDILQKKHKSELDQIDEFMESVPEYPKGYNNEWLLKEAFVDQATVLYRTEKKTIKGFCTRCQKEFDLKVKPKHLDTGKCPSCKKDITFRAYGKQKYISMRKNVGILQKTTNEGQYCLSVQDIEVIYKREDDYRNPEIRQYANYRIRLDKEMWTREEYEYTEYRNTGIIRWCHPVSHGMCWSYAGPTDYCVLYDKNLKQIRKGTDLEYVELEKVVRHFLGKQMHIATLLNTSTRYHEEAEKLIKVGLFNLAKEHGTITYPVDWLCHGMNRLEDLLGLDKERMRMAISMDVTVKELEVLQTAKRANVNMDEWQVREVAECYRNYPWNDIHFIIQRPNMTKTLRYLEKVSKVSGNAIQTVARDYEDYLNQLDRLRIQKTKNNRLPQDFYRAHEELTELIKENEDKLKAADTKKKNRMLKKEIERIKELYQVDSNKYEIVWPKSKNDFTKEGQLQHNCVGGYFEKMATGKTVVFFLRMKEDRNTPFCTVEFTNGRMKQCRTIYNRDAPEDAMKFMEKIEEHYMRITLEREREVV